MAHLLSRKNLAWLGLFALLYLVLAYAFYANVASKTLGANDYYSRWMGARLFFLQGENPYSETATRAIQFGMHGRLGDPIEDRDAFFYPFYTAFFCLPFVFMPYAWAESFWMALLLLLLGGMAIALAHLFRWRFSPLGLMALLAFAIIYYPSLRGIFLGQFAILVSASCVFGLVLLARGHDEMAGWVLAISSIKPQMAAVVLVVILGWGVWQRRWRLIRGFASGMGLLLVVSTVLLPTWLQGFLGALGSYQRFIPDPPPIRVWSELLFAAPASELIALAVSALLFGALLYQFWRTRDAAWEDFLPTVELAVIVTTMAMIRTATPDQTLLLIPWVHWLSNWVRGGQRQLALLSASVLVVVPWVLFLMTLHGNQEAPIATTGAVTLTLIAYVIIYGRTWLPLWRRAANENVAA